MGRSVAICTKLFTSSAAAGLESLQQEDPWDLKVDNSEQSVVAILEQPVVVKLEQSVVAVLEQPVVVNLEQSVGAVL